MDSHRHVCGYVWNHEYTNSYNGNDEVYVRLAQTTGTLGAKIFDIYIANAGEESKKLLEELNEEYTNGIQDISYSTKKIAAGIYNLNGARVNTLQRGINIVVYGDGQVKKVLVK